MDGVLSARETGCLCPPLSAQGHFEKQQCVSFSHISLSLSQTVFQLAHLCFLVVCDILMHLSG